MTEELTPSLRGAARALVDTVTKDGGSMTISSGGQTVHIGPAVVPTADGAVGTDHNETAPPSGELALQQPAGSPPNDPKRNNFGRLRGFIERVEKLEEERKAIGGDIRDVYSEAKGVGYDVKTIRKLVALRRMDAADRAEQETLLDTYKHALGMI